MASVANHLMVPSPAAPSSKCDPVELVPIAASMNDNYHKVHGNVSNKEVVWRNVAVSDGSTKDFTDIIYQKAVGEGIAKVRSTVISLIMAMVSFSFCLFNFGFTVFVDCYQ